MRVLEVMGSLHRGGAETMIMNYYRAFDKQMCQMDFVIHGRFEDDYCMEAQKMGAKIIELSRPGQVGLFKYIKELKESIKENGPYDAVHIHTNYQAFLAIIAARWAGVKKIIVHSHNTIFPKGTVLINRLVMDFIPVIRIGCGEAAGKAFFGCHQFSVINNAIKVDKFLKKSDVDYFNIKKRRFGEKKVIGHIGRFNIQKNHDFIIEVADLLRKKRSDVVFALYGEGEREEEIKKQVMGKNLQEQVLFMGVTSDTAIAYHTFDAFILPSNWEGFPVTLVEAQLSGVKSFASDRISKECDLKAGLIEFIPLEASVWVEKIEATIGNQDVNEKYVNPEMANKFDIDEQWKVLYKIYAM